MLLIVEPVTVVERCMSRQSVQCKPIQGAKLDHGADDNRVELAERTVRRH